MLAEKLNMTPEEAERWIVNLIRNAKLDAKIDSKLVIKLCLLWKKKNTTKEIIISIVSFLNGCYRELCYYSAKTVKSFSDERIILY